MKIHKFTSSEGKNIIAHINWECFFFFKKNSIQVLELVEGTHDRYQTCKRTDSLYSVMELLSDPGLYLHFTCYHIFIVV